MSSTHPAVVTVRPSAPLEIQQVPTEEPVGNEVKIVVQWTASTPLDLHQAAGHLLVKPPQILGDGVAGTVVGVGPDVKNFKLGDEVFGFMWRNAKEKAHQLFCVCPENLVGKIPHGHSMQEAVTLGNNFVTIWHVLTHDWQFELPWSQEADGIPGDYSPPFKEISTEHGEKKWIAIWGASSSTGMYAVQILKYYGYHNIICIASAKHHEKLQQFGASVCFDYRGEEDVIAKVKHFLDVEGGAIGYVLDCIGSLDGSLRPCSRLAEAEGCRVSSLLPVIVKDAVEGGIPEYSMDVAGAASWAKGVIPTGTRTHFYMDNENLAEHLQTDIMPWALRKGVVEPNSYIIVDGETLLDRAQKAINMLRDRQVSGARLVWRVAEEKEVKQALQMVLN